MPIGGLGEQALAAKRAVSARVMDRDSDTCREYPRFQGSKSAKNPTPRAYDRRPLSSNAIESAKVALFQRSGGYGERPHTNSHESGAMQALSDWNEWGAGEERKNRGGRGHGSASPQTEMAAEMTALAATTGVRTGRERPTSRRTTLRPADSEQWDERHARFLYPSPGEPHGCPRHRARGGYGPSSPGWRIVRDGNARYPRASKASSSSSRPRPGVVGSSM